MRKEDGDYYLIMDHEGSELNGRVLISRKKVGG